MTEHLSLIPVSNEGCEILCAEENRLILRVTGKKGTIELPAIPAGRITSAHTLLTGRFKHDSMLLQKLKFTLHNDCHTLAFTQTFMPTVEADMLFRTKYLDGSRRYPPMEPGTLKSAVNGDIRPEEITGMTLIFPTKDVTYTIEDLRFTDTEPPRRTDTRIMCDELGQWKDLEWPGKTASVEELRDALNAELAKADQTFNSHLDAYGGDKRFPIAEPSDRFRCVRHDGKWWLATPDGNAFYSLGVFGVYPGEYGWIHGNEDRIGPLPSPDGEFAPAWKPAESDELYRRKFSGTFPPDTLLYAFATANLIRTWGKDWKTNWTRLTAARMKKWAVNTLSMFSDPDFIRESGIPYVYMLHHFPTTENLVYREFPDVFSPAYAEAAEVYAAQLNEHAENPRLIGYFLNNEPTFAWANAWTLAEKVLERGPILHAHAALVAWLKEKYGTVSALNAAWKTDFADFSAFDQPIVRASEFSEAARDDLSDFTVILMRKYVEIPALACRRAAPKRLNLGMRYHDITELTLKTIDLFDVYSVNCYKINPQATLDKVSSMADMPVLIGEFHFGATDAGLPSGGLINAGTQEARAEAYRNYITTALSHPYSVGAHWFAWNDQPLWGRYDCENYGFGLVDICGRPHRIFTDAVRDVNSQSVELRMKSEI